MKTISLFIYLIVAQFAIFQVRAQTEADIIQTMYSGATDATDLSGDLISYAAHAVWAASTQTGQITTTGTLTQSTTDLNSWTYSATPNDKMVLKFASGATLNFQYTTINGYTDGTINDFLDSHNMDFQAEIQNKLNLHIISHIGPNAEKGDTEWNQTLQGTIVQEDISYTIDLNYSGAKKGDIGESISIYDYSDKTTGTVSSSKVKYTVDQAYRSHAAADRKSGQYAQDRFSLNNNAAQTASTTYKFSDAYCKWLSITYPGDSAYAVVNEPYNWDVSGQLLKNNTTFGQVQFDRTIVEGTYGPHLIARCTNSKDYLLSLLLNPVVSGLGKNSKASPTIRLQQNYPNPFTQTTIITYELQTPGQVVVEIFDATGKKLTTLVNKTQQPGQYNVRFNAKNLPAGHYFYRLKANGFKAVKKMILVK